MIHDPGMRPTGRPRHIPRFLMLEPDADRLARIDAVLKPFRPSRVTSEPIGSRVTPHRKETFVYDDEQHRLPDRVALAAARILQNIEKPGSIYVDNLLKAARMFADFYDGQLPMIELDPKTGIEKVPK